MHPFEIDEEQFLSVAHPKRISRPNEIYGQALFVHFSFRPHLDIIQTRFPELYKFYYDASVNHEINAII